MPNVPPPSNTRPRPEGLTSLVSSKLGIPASEISADSGFESELGLDRFDVLELVEELEAVFHRKLDDAVVAGVRCMSDLAEALEAASPTEPSSHPMRGAA